MRWKWNWDFWGCVRQDDRRSYWFFSLLKRSALESKLWGSPGLMKRPHEDVLTDSSHHSQLSIKLQLGVFWRSRLWVTPITRWSREKMFLLYPAYIADLGAKWICCFKPLYLGWFLVDKQIIGTSDQIRSVAQLCPTLCDPMNRSTPGLPVHHQLPEFTQTHVHRVSDAIQPSHLLSSPSPPAHNPSQHQSLFQWVNSSHEVAKVLEFQL